MSAQLTSLASPIWTFSRASVRRHSRASGVSAEGWLPRWMVRNLLGSPAWCIASGWGRQDGDRWRGGAAWAPEGRSTHVGQVQGYQLPQVRVGQSRLGSGTWCLQWIGMGCQVVVGLGLVGGLGPAGSVWLVVRLGTVRLGSGFGAGIGRGGGMLFVRAMGLIMNAWSMPTGWLAPVGVGGEGRCHRGSPHPWDRGEDSLLGHVALGGWARILSTPSCRMALAFSMASRVRCTGSCTSEQLVPPQAPQKVSRQHV